MTNVNSFDVSAMMREISKAAPLLLLIAAIASFAAVGIFAVDYYESLLTRFGSYSRAMAVLIASIQELVRFALLVATIRDFSDEKRFNGWLGLIGSVALVLHDVSVARSIAAMWSPDNPLPYSSVLIFLILVGLGLEIRLALTVDLKEKKEIKKEKKSIAPENEQALKNGAYTAVN